MNILKHIDNHNPYGLKMAYGSHYSLEETKTFFRAINITSEELSDLNDWVKDGNDFYTNPWLIYNDKGSIVNFIEGSRFVKDMFEEYLEHLHIPASPITDNAFVFDTLPF